MAPNFPDRYRPHLLALIVAAVFANSFWGVFVFDEYSSITRNETIRHLWPLDCMFKYPNNTRPVIGLSFAINYAIHQHHFWSYHLFNFAIHLTGALTLYGIALRTFLSERLKARYGRDAVRLAFFIALFWAIHPLQTASVTYVIQRCESLMGMFFLLTLYCAIRSDDSPHPERWIVASIYCCAMGMGSKQVMVVAPFMVLLYDRTFLSGSIADAAQKRTLLYLGYCATCLILVGSSVTPPGGASAGFGITCVTPYHYLLTQCAVIPYYLRLTFWPSTLCLDYVWPFAMSAREVWPEIVLLVALALVSVYGTIRNRPWGFLGAWFFVILAPSSSIMPIQDAIFEHRMYLPLAAVAAAFVLCVHWLVRILIENGIHPRTAQTSAAGVLFVLAFALSVRTIVRNCDYYSESRIWRKVVALYPESQRATNNLGNALAVEGAAMTGPAAREKHEESAHWFEECARISPNYADAQFNLGVEYNVLERKEDAIKHYERALELNPEYENANAYMADILIELHRDEQAIPHYEIEVRRNPSRDDLRKKLDDARAKLDSE